MATMTLIPQTRQPNTKLIAPLWHTLLLVALFLGLTLGGAFFQRTAISRPESLQHDQILPLYLSIIAMEWGLVYYLWKGGLRRSGMTLRELIGGRWQSARDVLVDVGLAALSWTLWMVVDKAWDRWIGPGHAASIQPLLPQRAVEILLWIGVSVSAGICEETVFRGYFQRQFAALTHCTWFALCLQAALFGIAHGYQGVEACLRIALLGMLYGLLALWRRSLRPGIVLHLGSDIMSGIFGI